VYIETMTCTDERQLKYMSKLRRFIFES